MYNGGKKKKKKQNGENVFQRLSIPSPLRNSQNMFQSQIDMVGDV